MTLLFGVGCWMLVTWLSVPRKKQLLTVPMKKKRLIWARKYEEWTEEQWEKVLFSDESHFLVQGQRSRYVRKSRSETLSHKHIEQTVKHPTKKMFWGCFSVHGPGPLFPVDGMMNSDKYIEVITRKVVPTLKTLWPSGDGIFQQDLAPCHKSRKVMACFGEYDVQCLDWPGNSPDLNPIENLWAILKGRMRKMNCTTKEMMITSLLKIWYKDDEVKLMCQKLVKSMPKRVKQVIKAKGGHISY